MIMRNTFALAMCATLVVLLASCSHPSPTGSAILVDPAKTSRGAGGTDDIYEAVQRALMGLSHSSKVSKQTNNRVVLDEIANSPGIPNYDEKIIYNKFLSELTNSSDSLVFLDRKSVQAERYLQQSGEVTTEGVNKLAGAAMALKIELRQLRGKHDRTIQYTFRLTSLDGVIVWTDSYEIKKRTR